MKKVLVLGAGGQIARWVIQMLANKDDVKLTLFLRHANKLKNPPRNSQVVQGDALRKEQLDHAMAEQDIIYANLTGNDIDHQAKHILDAMNTTGVKLLIFVTSLGIYAKRSCPSRFSTTIPMGLAPTSPIL